MTDVPTSLGKFIYTAAIFCDSVRREDNGKVILLGVFGGDLLVTQNYPVPLSLVAHLEGQVTEAGQFSEVFQFFDESGAALSPPVEVKSGGPFVLGGFAVQVASVITFQKSCTCVLKRKVGDEWEFITQKTVVNQSEIMAKLPKGFVEDLMRRTFDAIQEKK